MNQHGFFTLIGICFLLIAAILVKGMQESERNYSYVTRDFQTEVELQNIADSALVEAVDMIKTEQITLKKTARYVSRRDNQHEIFQKPIDDKTNVQVFYEYGKYADDTGNIQLMRREYKSGNVINDKLLSNKNKKGVIIISVASRDTDDGKVYRRALGYFLTDEDADGKIYFMNSL